MAAKLIEVEVISREIIKPSFPTPPHLRRYQLSFLDQTAPPVYMPLVLFYAADDSGNLKPDTTNASVRLKTSLSDTLTHYYPLAGQLKENLVVECHDEGVPYLETRVGCRLSEVLDSMDPVDLELQKLLPFIDHVHGNVLLGVQFNVFKCGGIALGVCLSHKVADAFSFFVFTMTWAAICGGEEKVTCPKFVGPKLFPPMESHNNPTAGARQSFIDENVITKRFVFEPHAIEALRIKYDVGGGTETGKYRRPSRVEALEAFIWSRFVASTQVYAQPQGGNFLIQTVNLRTKFEPPLPVHSFGNFFGLALALLSKDMGHMCDALVPRLRRARSEVDMEKQQRFLEGFEDMNAKGELVAFGFSSICGFPVYVADFGWGEPARVGIPSRPVRNTAVLMDTKSGDGGVEAYISLDKEAMAEFEKDEQMRTYVLFGKKCRL